MLDIPVKYYDSIESIKQQFQDLTGISIENIKMIWHKRELLDYQCFIDLGIGMRSTIEVLYSI